MSHAPNRFGRIRLAAQLAVAVVVTSVLAGPGCTPPVLRLACSDLSLRSDPGLSVNPSMGYVYSVPGGGIALGTIDRTTNEVIRIFLDEVPKVNASRTASLPDLEFLDSLPFFGGWLAGSGGFQHEGFAVASTSAVGVHYYNLKDDEPGPLSTLDTLPPDQQISRLIVADVANASALAGGGGDGALDIVVVSFSMNAPFDGTIRVYASDGEGAFLPPVSTALSPGFMIFPQAYFAAPLDVDGDGLMDLAIAGENSQFNGSASSAVIMRATGTGAFTFHASVSAPQFSRDIAAADVDGDALTDIIALGATGAGAPTLRISPGQGGGAFGAGFSVALGGFDDAAGLHAANVDGLNGAEVFIARVGRIEYFVSAGDGVLQGPIAAFGGSSIVDVLHVDEDGDGVADVVLALDGVEDTLKAFERVSGPGELFRMAGETRVNAGTTSAGVNAAAALVDVDGDGDLDVRVLTNNAVETWLNAPSGATGMFSFTQGASTAVPATARAMAVGGGSGGGDGGGGGGGRSRGAFDDVALAVMTSSEIYVSFTHDAALQPVFTHNTGSSIGRIEIADMNNDGRDDLVLQTVEPAPVTVLVNQSDGTFAAATTNGDLPASSGLEIAIAVGDIDGDGWRDIAYVRGTNNLVYIVLSDGAAGSYTFHSAIEADHVQQYTHRAILADVNGDGRADLVSSHFSPFSTSVPAEVYVRLASSAERGEGALFEAPVKYAMTPPPGALAAADMDDDGDLDLLVACARPVFGEPHGVRIMENLGDGTFVNGLLLARTGGMPRHIAVGQLDGALGPDVLVASTNEFSDAYQGLSIHTNTIAPAAPPAIPGDTNGDGVVDVDDLINVILGWGACPAPCPPRCPADVAPFPGGNCSVDVDDLIAVILNWN